MERDVWVREERRTDLVVGFDDKRMKEGGKKQEQQQCGNVIQL